MAILASMLWRRVDTPGHDTCRLVKQSNGWSLHGASIFRHASGPVILNYQLNCDLQWKTLSGRVRGIAGDRRINYLVSRIGKGWTLNGGDVCGLEDLVDLDLSFTLATNLVQLRRISIAKNKSVQLPVAWLDFETGKLTELLQTYERRSELEFWYEAPSVGYKGLLVFDANGFIRSYPGLWEAES